MKYIEKKILVLFDKTRFKIAYLIFSLLALFLTVFYWAFLGAKFNLNISDQLVGPNLFENAQVFKDALIPGVHSFFIKWPVFYIVKYFHYSSNAFIYSSVALCLLTVGLLVLILYRIEKRPIFFGSLCLVLASVLLLVPIEPLPGSSLPVNMAMIATRNIEYVIFIFSLVLIISNKGIRKWQYWLSVILLSSLVASDKLFFSISIGGSVLGLIVYSFLKKWRFVKIFAHWFGASILAGIIGNLLLVVINRLQITSIVSSTSTSYYAASGGAKNIGLGLIYGVMSIFTNLGANPATDAFTVKSVGRIFFNNLFSYIFIGYVVNISVLVFGLLVIYKIVLLSLQPKQSAKNNDFKIDNYYLLSLMLIFSSLIMFGLFVVTNHYYPADARYLTIVLFAVFISIATYLRGKKLKPNLIFAVMLLSIIGIISGLSFANNNYRVNVSAFNNVNKQNLLILGAVKNHPVSNIIGNYWRVFPLQAKSGHKQSVIPLGGCSNFNPSPTSTAWQDNYAHKSFAYILTLNGSLTNYPSCSISQVYSFFGKPNSSLLISGTISNPNELLLFYDKGTTKPVQKNTSVNNGSILPISINQISGAFCSGPTVMAIMAHEDDDLLFMNPEIQKDIAAGRCIVSVYLTAGDAGNSQFYWLGRQSGSEAAYGYMTSTSGEPWNKINVQLDSGQYLQIATQKNNPKISLVYMLLPDGNTNNSGFKSSNYETLTKLKRGDIQFINSVDNQSSYSKAQLINALVELMSVYRPSLIRTQSGYVGSVFMDHPDHVATSYYATQALALYENNQYQNLITIPIYYYLGYPVHELEANISSGPDFEKKVAAFLFYSRNDPSTCNSYQDCLHGNNAYKYYLSRNYEKPY